MIGYESGMNSPHQVCNFDRHEATDCL